MKMKILLALLVLLVLQCTNCYINNNINNPNNIIRKSLDNNNNNNNKRLSSLLLKDRSIDDLTDLSNDIGRKGMKGYYRRPSRAIEKGGGFFIPGFENERIRILSSTILLVLLIINRSGVQITTTSQIITELTGTIMILLLFLQGIADRFRIDSFEPISMSNTGNYITTIQKSNNSNNIDNLENIARAIVQTSSDISYILVLSKDNKVLLELSPISSTIIDESSCDKLGNILRSQEKVSLDLIKTMNTWKLNENIKNIEKVIDNNNGMWLIGSNGNSEEFINNINWIRSLIECPI